MYKVLIGFSDMQDNGFVYRPGDTFPRTGAKASDERVKVLSSHSNRLGYPLIEEVRKVQSEEAKTPKRPRKERRKDT